MKFLRYFYFYLLIQYYLTHIHTLTKFVLRDDTLRGLERIRFSDIINSFDAEQVLLAMSQTADLVTQHHAHTGIGPSSSRQIHLLDDVMQNRAATVIKRMSPGQVATFLGNVADFQRLLRWRWSVQDGDSCASAKNFVLPILFIINE